MFDSLSSAVRSLTGSSDTDEIAADADGEIRTQDPPDEQPNNANAGTGSPIEFSPSYGHIKDSDRYFRTYVFDSWPAKPQEHMFWELLTDTTLEYDMAIHYDRHDKIAAVSTLDDLSRKLNEKAQGYLSKFTANPEGIKRTANIVDKYKDRVEQKGENLFSVTVYLTVYADTTDELRELHNDLESSLKMGPGVGIDVATYEQDIALRGSGPLGFNEYYDRHGDNVSQMMTGSVAATMFPYVSDTIFEEGGVNFGINRASNTPAIVDPFNRPTGYHTLRLGRTGSGKTFSASDFALKMHQNNPDLTTAIVDPMGDFVGVNHALGGDRILIDGKQPINPLEIRETPERVLEKSGYKMDPFVIKLKEVEWFFSQYYQLKNDDLDSKRRSVLSMATKIAYHRNGITEDPETHSKESPTMLDIIDIVEDISSNPEEYADSGSGGSYIDIMEETAAELILELRPFKPGNRYGNLSKQTDLTITGESVTYIDMTAISARDDSLGLMMQLIFSHLYKEAQQTEGNYMLMVDEAHRILSNEQSVKFMEKVFRGGRHFGLSVQMISQTFEEFFTSEAAKTIARMASIVQYHQMDRIDKELAKETMDLNDKQIEMIKNLTPGDGSKDYADSILHVSDKGWIPIRVSTTQDAAAVIDYDPSEPWSELKEPQSQRIKQALDRRQELDAPIVDIQENDLETAVLNRVMDRQKRIQSILIENGVNPIEWLDIDPATETLKEADMVDPENQIGDDSQPDIRDASDTAETDGGDPQAQSGAETTDGDSN